MFVPFAFCLFDGQAVNSLKALRLRHVTGVVSILMIVDFSTFTLFWYLNINRMPSSLFTSCN